MPILGTKSALGYTVGQNVSLYSLNWTNTCILFIISNVNLHGNCTDRAFWLKLDCIIELANVFYLNYKILNLHQIFNNDSRLEPHMRNCAVSLSKALYPILINGSTQDHSPQND